MSLEISTAGQDRFLATQIRVGNSSGVTLNKRMQSDYSTHYACCLATAARHYFSGIFKVCQTL